MNPFAAIALILLILLILFFGLNTDPVEVNFLLAKSDISLSLIIILSTLIGLVLGFILPRVFRRREEHYRIPENEEKEATKNAE